MTEALEYLLAMHVRANRRRSGEGGIKKREGQRPKAKKRSLGCATGRGPSAMAGWNTKGGAEDKGG